MDMSGGIIDEASRNGSPIVPQHLSGLRIEREGIVRAGKVHDAIYNHWRRFQDPGSFGMKDPLRLKVCGILGSDLSEAAEAAAGIVSVVSGPIVFDGAGNLLRRKIGSQATRANNQHPHPAKLHAV